LAAGEEYFWNFEIAWPEREISDVLTPDTLNEIDLRAPAQTVERIAARFHGSRHENRDYINYIVYSMMQDQYFGNLMMGKMDLLSSHFGIEVRSPYTEPHYAHFVYNVPAQFK